MTMPKQLIFFVSFMCIDSVVTAMDATPASVPAPAEQKPFDSAGLVKFLQENTSTFEVGQSRYNDKQFYQSVDHTLRKDLAKSIMLDLSNSDFNGEMHLTTKAIDKFIDLNFFLWKFMCIVQSEREPSKINPQPEHNFQKKPKYSGFKTFLMCAASTGIGAGVATAFFLLRK